MRGTVGSGGGEKQLRLDLQPRPSASIAASAPPQILRRQAPRAARAGTAAPKRPSVQRDAPGWVLAPSLRMSSKG